MQKNTIGKYKFLVLSIALFILFDLGVLMLNFYTSTQITKQTEKVNLAARQRTLSQQLSKSTLYVKSQKLQSFPYGSGLDELQHYFRLFDRTHEALLKGGTTRGTQANSDVKVSGASTSNGRRIVSDIDQLWQEFRVVLTPLLADQLITQEEILPASNLIRKESTRLYELTNDLTNHFKYQSNRQTQLLRYAQIIGIALATINFFVILFHFIKQLRQRDNKIEHAKQESDDILSTINEGLFLIDKDYQIAGQYSQHLESLFETSRVAGRDFRKFLNAFFTKQTAQTATQFIDLFFAEHVNEELVDDLNPLKQVKASFDGVHKEKYLDFSFKRIPDHGQVLVVAKDVTEKVLLAQQVEQTKQTSREELALVTEILPIPKPQIQGFIEQARICLDQINDYLKQPVKYKADYRQKIDSVFNVAHKLKGDASAIGFSIMSDRLHDFEEELVVLRDARQHTGDDFLPLTIKLKALYERIDIIESLTNKLLEYRVVEGEAALSTKESSDNQVWSDLVLTTEKMALKHGKKVELHFRGFRDALSEETEQPLRDIVLQLVRNSIIHGIESPHERSQLLKPECGQITLTLSSSQGDLRRLSYEDDGRGIQFDQIRQRLREQAGSSAEGVGAMTHRDLVLCLFRSGFSTAKDITEEAGRGVGLPLIRRLTKQMGARLNVTFDKHSKLRFTVEFKNDQLVLHDIAV